MPSTKINTSIPRSIQLQGQTDISYDLSLVFVNSNNNNIIICEAIKPIVFNKMATKNYIQFNLKAKSYDGSTNSLIRTRVDYPTSINSLNTYYSPNDYQPITFYAIDSCQNILEQESRITFYLKIIDTKIPNVRKLVNVNFTDSNILEYPLLSTTAISKLKTNINYFDSFENSYLNYIKYYKLQERSISDTSYIVLVDPGIAIEDIVDGSLNFINDVLDPSINNFIINLSYTKNLLYSDTSNILSVSGNYIQNYNVKDKAGNSVDISRIIIVKSFPPIIRLNYQHDSCGNNYTKYLLQKYEKFVETNGYVRDFSDINISFENVICDYTNLNENIEGHYSVNYSVKNSINILGSVIRQVEVYNPIVLEKNKIHNFLNLLTNNSNFNNYSKFSLANGVYKFDVLPSYAFKLVTQDFDTSKNSYDVSNLITLTSDSSFVNSLGEKYYDGSNVILTISGNFERCSVKFKDSTTINTSFKAYLQNNTFVNLFIYDNINYFVNLQNYYDSLRDTCMNITGSFEVQFAVLSPRNLIAVLMIFLFYKFINDCKLKLTHVPTH
jgi:hypothetical protein